MDVEPGPTNRASEGAWENFPRFGDKEFLLGLREDPSGYMVPDFVRDDRRSVVNFPISRSVAQYVDHTLPLFDLTGTAPDFAVEETVAVRGGLCAAMRCSYSIGESRSDFLNVFRINTNDEVEISVLFDSDDRDAALTELDRLQSEVAEGTS